MMRHVGLALAVMSVAALAGCGGNHASPSGHGPVLGTLFVDAGRLIAVDTHTGRSRTLPIRLDCGDAMFCIVPSGGKLVIGSVGKTYVYDPQRPGRPRARHLGNGWIIIPSVTDRRVWLGLLDHSRPPPLPERKLRAVREETLAGHVTEDVRTPNEDWPVGAVKAGLLFQTLHSLRLWDPKTRKVTRRIPGLFPVDTYDNLVASCGEPCPRFDITDAQTGKTTRVPPPPGYSFRGGYDGAFSPDGSFLALPVIADRRQRRPNEHGSYAMALVDVGRGTARIIDGSRLDSIYHAMSWSASGVRLFFSAAAGRIMAYRPGSPRATNFARVRGPIYQMAAL